MNYLKILRRRINWLLTHSTGEPIQPWLDIEKNVVKVLILTGEYHE